MKSITYKMICIKKTKENYHQTHKPGSVLWDFAAHKMHHQHVPLPLGIESSKATAQTHCPTKCNIIWSSSDKATKSMQILLNYSYQQTIKFNIFQAQNRSFLFPYRKLILWPIVCNLSPTKHIKNSKKWSKSCDRLNSIVLA